MKTEELLKSFLAVGDVHSSRLEKAFHHIAPLLPLQAKDLENLRDEDLGFLELLTNRFSKLQDLIGTKIFPLILEILQEDSPEQSLIDRLHKLEKLGILPSADAWVLMRKQRNQLAHDYPDQPELMAKNLNKAIDSAQSLQNYWATLREFISTLTR